MKSKTPRKGQKKATPVVSKKQPRRKRVVKARASVEVVIQPNLPFPRDYVSNGYVCLQLTSDRLRRLKWIADRHFGRGDAACCGAARWLLDLALTSPGWASDEIKSIRRYSIAEGIDNNHQVLMARLKQDLECEDEKDDDGEEWKKTDG